MFIIKVNILSLLLSRNILSSSGAKNVLYVSWNTVAGIVNVLNVFAANSAAIFSALAGSPELNSSTADSRTRNPIPALNCAPVSACIASWNIFLFSNIGSFFNFLAIKSPKNKKGAAGNIGLRSYLAPESVLPSYQLSPANSDILNAVAPDNAAIPTKPLAACS